jgi:hypothetical protein
MFSLLTKYSKKIWNLSKFIGIKLLNHMFSVFLIDNNNQTV